MRMFENRKEAAEELSRSLEFLRAKKPLVLGLLNGGLILAEIVARELDAPLDVLLIQKLMAPKGGGHVVGVVDEHGRISMIETTARWHHLTSQKMVEPARKAFANLQKRKARIREILPEIDVRGRTVVVVDEGVATGARMLGAISSLRDRGALKIAVAAPAGASKATWQLRDSANDVVIPHTPNKFKGVERFYKHCPTISDEMVCTILKRHVAERPEFHQEGVRTISSQLENSLGIMLNCEMDLPPAVGADAPPAPAVVFAHGFESNGISPRNVPISRRLAKRGIIGVRVDFTGHGCSEGVIEDATDEQMLADLTSVFSHLTTLKEVDRHRLGLVGSGTGGYIALEFAAHEPLLGAMVLRGPLCGDERELAARVQVPTLLIHAECDTALEEGVNILDEHLGATHECVRVPDSNRLFNDPISLELMIGASVDWLADYLRRPPRTPVPVVETAAPPNQVEAASEQE